MTSLRRLRGRATGSDAFLDADLLRDMSLEAVDYSTAFMDQSDGLKVVGFVSTLERLVVGTACGASLRELNIGGLHGRGPWLPAPPPAIPRREADGPYLLTAVAGGAPAGLSEGQR